MKKNLRLLCLGLAAAAFTSGFAQVDKTSLLGNPTMEPGVKGWSFAGSSNDMMKKGHKNSAVEVGYHGISGNMFEAYRAKATKPGTGGETGKPEVKYFPAVPDGFAKQRLSGLEPGTYVFGAYVGATNQGDSVGVCPETIEGVYLFAKGNRVPVATNNPEMKGNPKWAHTAKFNVAVTLSENDELPGYMDVGLDIDGTNANFILWDNATLYYFGDKSEEEALNEMAKIDILNSLAIADTLEIGTESEADTLVFNVDTLTNYLAALAKARKCVEEGTVTAANLYELNEDIYYNKGLVHKSVSDYKTLMNAIKNAQKITATPEAWVVSEDADESYIELLEAEIAAAEEAYEKRELNRAELADLRKVLNFAVGDVKIDSVYRVAEILKAFINDEMLDKENVDGGYTTQQIQTMKALQQELADTLGKYDTDFGNEERKVNPNDLYAYVNRVLTAIKNAKDSPMTLEYTEMPIFYPRAEETINTNAGNHKYAKGSFKNAEGLLEFTSPLYRFRGNVETFRITVTGTGTDQEENGYVFFTLSGLKFYDANGAEIPLDATMVTSNADHNTLNPGAEDGQGIPALFDNDGATYFHSAWEKGPAEPHYLEITLPNGGYDAFSFSMVSREDGHGGTQHNFPAELTVNTPTPERDRLEANYNRLVNLKAYTSNEVGFYANDFSEIRALIAEIAVMLEGYPAESVCSTKADEAADVLEDFVDNQANYIINLPEEGKAYQIVNAFAGFYNNQSVEKALTVHYVDKKPMLWWETAGVDSVNQKFMFEPILEKGEHKIEDVDGTLNYYYAIKNVATNLYIDSMYVDNTVKFDATCDTAILVSFGAGQWDIRLQNGRNNNGEVKTESMHCGDHNGGSKGTTEGAYGEGGIRGVTSGIIPYWTGAGGSSSWYIREMVKFPINDIEVAGEEFKSECYHFDGVNNIEVIADKACAFENLKLYNLLGDTLAVDTIIVKDNVAKIITPKNIVECSVAFTNNEGVSEIDLNGYFYISKLGDLEAAYEKAAALKPTVGDSIGQCKDITAYTEVIAAAETMLEEGATDEEMVAMIKRLEKVVSELEFVLPTAGKYYYIVSAVDGFEKQQGYRVALYAKADGTIAWAPENDVDNRYYWQFEPASKDDLTQAGAADTLTAFWVKNVGTEEYFGVYKTGFANNLAIPMAPKSETVPYVVTPLGSGAMVALDASIQVKDDNGNNKSGRIHALSHSSGGNRLGNTTYWDAEAGSASSWRIIEVEYDATDIDFAEVETEKAVVKGTYDLFGRRIVAPTAPGLYIIDGKKTLVK